MEVAKSALKRYEESFTDLLAKPTIRVYGKIHVDYDFPLPLSVLGEGKV